ncbi:MAG: hypothetical protein JWQ07_3081 [Ramlibacter sp.]|nr:hypothetical protein [Ramlibacter sp.]
MRPMSLGDRIVIGAIAGVMGAVLGLVAAFLLAFAFESPPALRPIAIFSAVFFFVIGAVRGPDAGFFVGDALSALIQIGADDHEIGGGREGHGKPGAWSSVWLLATWGAIVLAIAWRA